MLKTMTTNKVDHAAPALTFRMGTQLYGLPIDYVVEVAAMVELITLPDAPYGVLGFANRHGVALPMLDMRAIFDIEGDPITAATLFIVAQCDGQLAGLVVDEVYLVEYLALRDLRNVPSMRKYIQGILHDGDRLLQIVALARLFAEFVPQINDEQRHIEDGA
jgi:purine-binding chemotaxis protein CheW